MALDGGMKRTLLAEKHCSEERERGSEGKGRGEEGRGRGWRGDRDRDGDWTGWDDGTGRG